jgi:hypothetical protein
MTHLQDVKAHLDAHGVGCAVIGDQVAIGVIWTTRTISGEERREERILRVSTLADACDAIGCACLCDHAARAGD